MVCPRCADPKSEVVDSRKSKNRIRRRRTCVHCSHTWTTYEQTEEELRWFSRARELKAQEAARTIKKTMESVIKQLVKLSSAYPEKDE